MCGNAKTTSTTPQKAVSGQGDNNLPRVLISPTRDDKGSGLSSRIQYQNADFLAGIRVMFNAKPWEQIRQVEIDSEGITVRIRIDREPTSAPTPLKKN